MYLIKSTLLQRIPNKAHHFCKTVVWVRPRLKQLARNVLQTGSILLSDCFVKDHNVKIWKGP